MSTPTLTVPPGIRLSSRRMTIVTAALLFALIGYSIPSNMLVPLLVSLEAAYHISAVAAIWISLIALLSGASFVPTLCRLGDTMGWKKSLVIFGLGCLAVGALIAAVSSSLPLLLVGRAISGVGLVLFPMLAGIINDEFPVMRRKVAISLMSAFLFLGLGVGGVIAGISGAVLVEFISAWSPGAWLYQETFVLFAAVIVGGTANNAGAALGALLVPVAFLEGSRFLPQFGPPGLIDALQWVAVGLMTLVFLWFWPRGVLPERRRIIQLPGQQQARTGLQRPVDYEKTAETR